MKKIFLSIIIPAFNEQERIGDTLQAIIEYCQKQNYECEIIVVSDGSTDRTKDIVKQYQSVYSNLKIINNLKNRGKGFVVKQGMLQAHGEWCLFMDADNSTRIQEIERFWQFSKDYKILFGSREPNSKTTVIQPIKRKIVSKFSNFIIRYYLKTKIKDTQCGFKLFHHSVIDTVFEAITIERFGFDMEIVAIAQAQKIKIKTIPINWTNATGSKVRALLDLKRSLIDLLIIRDNLKKNIY